MMIGHTQFERRNMSKLIKGIVVPRPIAWISSIDEKGTRNLAPFSFFTVASMDPITLCFSIGTGGNVEEDKDTLANIKWTGEFVIKIVSEPLANKMYESSKYYKSDQNEFYITGLRMEKGELVGVPKVAEALAQMECQVR